MTAQVVLDHDYSVAIVNQPMKHVEQKIDIGHVQTNRRLLQEIQGRSRLAHFAQPLVFCPADAAFELRDKFQALCLPTAQGRTGLPKLEITKPGLDKVTKAAARFSDARKRSRRLPQSSSPSRRRCDFSL